MENPPPILGKILINASSYRFELGEMLTGAEKTGRIDLLKLAYRAEFYIELKKYEFDRLGVYLKCSTFTRTTRALVSFSIRVR